MLQDFSARVGGIHYSLLSDPDSKIIRAFGILNTNFPEGNAGYGIPFPGMFVVDAEGVVRNKFFEENHNVRFTARSVLTKSLGERGAKATEVRREHLDLVSYASDEVVTPGSIVTLVVEAALPEKVHVYAPEVTGGYRPVSFTIEENPYIEVHPAEYPESEDLFLPAIKETVPVFEGKLRVVRDVTVAFSLRDLPEVTIDGNFQYQACDDKVCYPPDTVPLRFDVGIEPLDHDRVPEELQRKRSAPAEP